MSTTLLALEKLIAKELGYASGICSEAGTTTTIVDSSTDSPLDPDDDENVFQNAWTKIEADSAGTPLNVGEVRRIRKEGYTPSLSRLTVARAFSNATTTTQSYGVYPTVPPTRVGIEKGLDEYINEALRLLPYRTYALLTLVTDGDMETSGTTNWTASNSTLTKSTTASYVSLGTQSLRVVNSSADGYARSVLISVVEQQTYHCVADVRVSSGTSAKLQLYDETNSAEIDSATTTQGRQGYLYLDNGYIPADCKQVSVRLIGTGASDDIYWDNVSLRNAAATEISLPSWLTRPSWIDEVYHVGGGGAESSASGLRYSDERRWPVVHYWNTIEDHSGANPYKLTFWPAVTSWDHLIVKARRPYSELTADTGTTNADQDWVKAWVLTAIYRDKGPADKYKFWREEANRLHRHWAPVYDGRPFKPHKDL